MLRVMPVPVISIAQMREWERATWAAGQSEAEVIRRVGRALAEVALRLTRDGDRIMILAGKGHNGDDARCAQEHLAGRRLDVLEVRDPGADLAKLDEALAELPGLVIDGLFGLGINRPLENHWIQFIGRLNEARCRVLAVDLPSGLNGDTGESFGAAIEAEVTLTVGAPKSGLLTPAAVPWVGRLEVAKEVGLLPCPFAGELLWTMAGDFADFPPRRAQASHKGTYGHLAIISGSRGYHGAAVLATRAAQRAQPGLVSLFIHEPAYPVAAAQLQAAMVHPWTTPPQLEDWFQAVLVGPGLAATGLATVLEPYVRQIWSTLRLPVVVDASALDWLAAGPVPAGQARVITPHPGEAARMLGATPAQVQRDRPRALRELSHKYGGCHVVLKGHQTLIGRSEGPLFVNSSGNAHLAQGGSGDALAGYLSGLLAQPVLQRDPQRAIRFAVWQHGAAADCLERVRPNWVVEDLAAALGAVSATGRKADGSDSTLNFLPLREGIC
jgi:hydroxyethylthiazole kinase-like uncharacterized protein yjeF